jgi:hypothetical protein
VLVTGQVVNGSGTGIPAGLEVSLQGYSQFELTVDLTAPVAEDGNFIFEDVPMQAEDVFVAVVEYEEMFYPSDFYVAGGDEQDLVFEVEVFDTTTDTSALVVARAHVFFEWVSPDLVQVGHLVTVSNLENETVYTTGETEPVLTFSLPEGAVNLAFERGTLGDPYVATAEGFGDPRPIAPGEAAYEVLYFYQMPYERGLTWTLPIDLPTQSLQVFVMSEEVKLESDQLNPAANQMVENGVYQTLTGTSLAAGDQITMEISGRVKLEGSESGLLEDANPVVIVAGVLGLGLAVFGIWQFFRTEQAAEDDDLDELDADTLIDEIVALDEAFEAGEIDERDYRERRAGLKGLLREMMEDE